MASTYLNEGDQTMNNREDKLTSLALRLLSRTMALNKKTNGADDMS